MNPPLVRLAGRNQAAGASERTCYCNAYKVNGPHGKPTPRVAGIRAICGFCGNDFGDLSKQASQIVRRGLE